MDTDNDRVPSIIHCDMDAFFASVEQLKNPELRGKPVIVGGKPHSRGVVSTCSYEARKYGVRSAMPLAEAYRRCPEAVFIPPDFSAYQEASDNMHKIFSEYTPLIEPISLDEAFLDVTKSLRLFGSPLVIGQKIKERIKNELGLIVSVGIAHNKFLAKLASDLSKPDGFLVVTPDQVRELLDPLDIRRIWGIGEKTAQRLYELNIKTIRDLCRLEEAYLTNLFGSCGSQLYLLARGIDRRKVENVRKAKSIGRETTFPTDISDMDDLEKCLLTLAGDVARSLRRERVKGYTVTLKIKYQDFRMITRSKTLDKPTDLEEVIFAEACFLLQKLVVKPIRLAGVSLHNLTDCDEPQLSMFEESREQKAELVKTIDRIKDKYGEKSITRARLVEPKKKPAP